MYKKGRTEKGITLIALVITIIVMLILVGVTISMAVKGGLFDYAGKAASETKNALDAEQEVSNGMIKVDGVWYDSIDDYLAGKKSFIKPTSITISGEENVEVGRTITLLALNQEGQEIPSEDIEWTLTWDYQDEFTDIATVDNGVVTGVSLQDWYTEMGVMITATYIPDKNIVATKGILVKPHFCEDCNGSGVSNYYLCPLCNKYFENAEVSLVYEEVLCLDCYDSSGDIGDDCTNCGSLNSFGYTGYKEYKVTFPCCGGSNVMNGSKLDGLWEHPECESCSGVGEIYS